MINFHSVNKRLFLGLLLTLLFLGSFAESSDARQFKIIAVVNGEAISNIQLKDRVNVIMSSSGMDDNLQNRRKVTRDAYDILINEVLQRQEAESKGITLTDADIDFAVKDLEKKNGIASGGLKKFIKSKGLSYEASLDQIKAGLLWKKTVSRFFRNKVEINDSDVANEASKYSSKDIKRNVSISEIVLPIDYDDKAKTKRQADGIVKEARAGKSSFEKLARQHSVGKTAKNGGRVGWIPADKVMPKLRDAVASIKVGEVSEPIFIDSLYVIIKKNDYKVYNPATDEKMIKEKVLMSKLEKQAKRYVKELRQKALVERKILPEELT